MSAIINRRVSDRCATNRKILFDTINWNILLRNYNAFKIVIITNNK